MDNLNEKMVEYQSAAMKVNKLESLINDFFVSLSKREDVKIDRCSDYGERSINIIIPFDEINLNLIDKEKFEKIREVIKEHRKLRNMQKKIEREINELNSITNVLKGDIDNYDFY